MKTFNKTYLPDEVTYNGEKYALDVLTSSLMNVSNTNPKTIIERLKRQGKKGVLVQVLSNSLKGRTDLYGKPYKPTQWIFTNN